MGWAKLSILATYGEAETIDDLLDVAEDCTAHELKMYSAMAIDPDGQTVVLHLDSEQYALLEQALLAEGARLELKDVGAILDSHYLNRDSALGDTPLGRSKGEQRLPTDVGVSGDDLGKTV